MKKCNFSKLLVKDCVLACPLDNGNKKINGNNSPLDDGDGRKFKKNCIVDPWLFCGTHQQKRSKF